MRITQSLIIVLISGRSNASADIITALEDESNDGKINEEEYEVYNISCYEKGQEEDVSTVSYISTNAAEELSADENGIEEYLTDDAQFTSDEQQRTVEQNDDDDSELYNCNVCGVNFIDIQEHIEKYHSGQDVVLDIGELPTNREADGTYPVEIPNDEESYFEEQLIVKTENGDDTLEQFEHGNDTTVVQEYTFDQNSGIVLTKKTSSVEVPDIGPDDVSDRF